MGYSGTYYCPVRPCEIGFELAGVKADKYVVAESGVRELVRGNAGQSRVTMIKHGADQHGQSWESVGNEQFLPEVMAAETQSELRATIRALEGQVAEWEAGNLVREE